MNTKEKFLKEMDEAGYVEEYPEDILDVIEFEDRYRFIHVDGAIQEYTVGEFLKGTSTSCGDFLSKPLLVTEDYGEAEEKLLS